MFNWSECVNSFIEVTIPSTGLLNSLLSLDNIFSSANTRHSLCSGRALVLRIRLTTIEYGRFSRGTGCSPSRKGSSLRKFSEKAQFCPSSFIYAIAIPSRRVDKVFSFSAKAFLAEPSSGLVESLRGIWLNMVPWKDPCI